MSGKFIIGLLALVMFSTSIHAVAAPGEPMKEKISVRGVPSEPMKAIEAVTKEYKEKAGKMDQVSLTSKKAMIDSLNAYTAKGGVVETRSMVRLLFSPKVPRGSQKAFMEKYEQLVQLKQSGTAEEKEMATLKLQLYNSIGTYTDTDYKSKEFNDAYEAALALGNLEGKQFEKGKAIVEKFVQARAEGKTFVESVDKAFSEKSGGYKAFCGACPDSCKL
jgi:CRISPR/Cas system-associated exonuclease Cas4 (RecB family)